MKVLITGGSGDIAKALAKELKRLNFNVDTPSSNELDVSNHDSVVKYFIGKNYDIVINNAGVIFPDPIKNSNYHKWVKTIEVNLIGTYNICVQALLSGNPKIINIASTSGLNGRANWSAYCASKAGVISLTESLVAEGIDAHCIILGRTNTKMRRALFPNEDQSTLRTIDSVVEEIICLLK